MAEKLGLGYLVTGLIVLGVIAAAGIAWKLGLDAVLAFWIAYILTRPLGASVGDYLSQSKADGGLGLGATITSAGFLAAILAVVIYLAMTQRDFIAEPAAADVGGKKGSAAVWQVVVVTAVLLGAGGTGYYVRQSQLQKQAAASVSPDKPLGDLSTFRKIASDMLGMARAGDAAGAKTRADDLETAWDNGQGRMQPMNPDKWTSMDNAIDDVLKKTRSSPQNGPETSASLESFIALIDTLDHPSEPPAPSAAPTSG